jgi:hypothetical protein
LGFYGCGAHLVVGGVFYAKLNPPASAEQCYTDGVQIAVALVVVRNELNLMLHPPQAALIITMLSFSCSVVAAHSLRGIIRWAMAIATPRSGRLSSSASSWMLRAEVSVFLPLIAISMLSDMCI